MTIKLIIFLLLFIPSFYYISSSTKNVDYASLALQPARLFRVNLDLPPRERWHSVLDAYKDDVIPRIAHMARSYVPSKLRSPVFGLFARLTRFLPYEFGEELRGMAEYLAGSGINLGELVALNVLYDMTDFAHVTALLTSLYSNNTSISPQSSNADQHATLNMLQNLLDLPVDADLQFIVNNAKLRAAKKDQSGNSTADATMPRLGCTSIVAANRNGQIFHARNLDYAMTELLKDATILVDFVRNGKVQYTSVSFVLAVGVLTGQRAGEFTLSLNARYAGGPVENLLMELLTRFHHPITYELREVLQTADNYLIALNRLSTVQMIAPSYIILGGTAGDGAIITRDRLGAADVYLLDYLHHRWFLLETNYDHWKKAGDKRRRYGRKYMERIGRDRLTPQALFKRVLAKWPIRNRDMVYSTVMSAAEPELIYNFTGVWKN